MRWLACERRWRDALLAAAIPRVRPDGHPGLAELDLSAFWRAFEAAAPAPLRLGFRAAVWALTWTPFFLIGRPRAFPALAPADRDRVLRRAARHHAYALRQCALVVKVVACYAYFDDPGVLARVGGSGRAARGPATAPAPARP